MVVQRGPDGLPAGAIGTMLIAAPVARVWEVVRDVGRYAQRVPMVHRASRNGDRVSMQLKFKLAIFSAKFGFTADLKAEEQRWLELQYVSGEPAEIRLRFELEPAEGDRATLTRAHVSFDIQSLGWLVKYFLRHHPEIQYGVFPGTTLVLLDSIRKAAE